jgi:hypothetical protein
MKVLSNDDNNYKEINRNVLKYIPGFAASKVLLEESSNILRRQTLSYGDIATRDVG